MKINELLRKNVNNIAGNIHTIEVNLNKFKGPFLSTIIPRNGPIIIILAVWHIIKNCKALPSIPIRAPKVLPVLTIKEKQKVIKS